MAKDTVTVYRDASGDWRWRRTAEGNNLILAVSSEGYRHQDHATSMARRVNGGDYDFVLVAEGNTNVRTDTSQGIEHETGTYEPEVAGNE